MEAQMIIGYARVSTDAQDTQAQLDLLHAAGCERVYAEKISGARSDRRQLANALNALGPGGTLIVTKLDRLARSLKDLLLTLDAVTLAGAGFRCLDVPALDTTTPYGQLLLNVLGALAQFERSLIISRTSEGRRRAMANGVKFGRKHALNAHQRQEALARLAAGERLRDIAKTFNVSHSTIARLA